MRGTIDAETEPWIRHSPIELDAAAYGRPRGPVELPDNWTPAQAEAVLEVLNLLFDAVCSKYVDALLEAGCEDLLVEAQWPGSGGGDEL